MGSPWISSLQLILLSFLWRGTFTTETTLNDSVTKHLNQTVEKAGDRLVERIEIYNPINLMLECSYKVKTNISTIITGVWRKDETEIGEKIRLSLENYQYNMKKIFSINETNFGNYSCIFSHADKESSIEFYLAVPEMDSKKNKPIVSYVGDSVKMNCKIKVSPQNWVWYKENETAQELINVTADPLRYQIKTEGNITKLTVMKLTERDSGYYICEADYRIKASKSKLTLRVISYMEPLKPFIAIMAEVLLLVVLIFLYERWSSKKIDSPAENMMHGDQMHNLTQEAKNGVEENTTRQRKV
ncbi:hypothetical protein UPYG_G00187430 [Umbra pygmaea]|uniref:Ig-like domain-containing protein n=1 Tax=Umbra pygmaea TaxID=75934 RepID=A0ABD0XCY9_UMBPY